MRCGLESFGVRKTKQRSEQVSPFLSRVTKMQFKKQLSKE
jgi:hypothetical protein